MANIRTNPAEWFRMLELLNTPDLTAEQEQELKEVASIFNAKQRITYNKRLKNHTKVVLYNPAGEIVRREVSIRRMAEYLGMPSQTLTRKSKAQTPLNVKGYEGYVVVREGEDLGKDIPDDMKTCGRCCCLKYKSEFINERNGREMSQCTKCRKYYKSKKKEYANAR